MRKLLNKIKNSTWDKLSFTSRNNIKWALAGSVAFAAIPALGMLALASASIGTALVTFGYSYAAIAVLGVNIPKRISEILHANDTVKWTNAVGQKIESTKAQYIDLKEYEERIRLFSRTVNGRNAINRHSKEMARFNIVADRVTVTGDVPGNLNNRFQFYTPPAHTYNFDPDR